MVGGWILILIGIVFAFFGIGGSAKADLGAIGVITASAGVILIIIGAVLVSI